MARVLRVSGQFVLLWAIFWISNELALVSGLPVPGNVLGVILLFILLSIGIIKVSHIEEAADFLLKHLTFFFIPIAVGLMNWGEVFYEYGVILAVAILISAVLPFWVVGYITQLLHGRKKKCGS